MLTLFQPYAWGHWTIPYQYPMVQEDPWETLKSRMDKYDAEMCKAWNGELDTILTFVCLEPPLSRFWRPDIPT